MQQNEIIAALEKIPGVAEIIASTHAAEQTEALRRRVVTIAELESLEHQLESAQIATAAARRKFISERERAAEILRIARSELIARELAECGISARLSAVSTDLHREHGEGKLRSTIYRLELAAQALATKESNIEREIGLRDPVMPFSYALKPEIRREKKTELAAIQAQRKAIEAALVALRQLRLTQIPPTQLIETVRRITESLGL
jgi:hypothetical protein